MNSSINFGCAGLLIALALLPATARAEHPDGPVDMLKEPVVPASLPPAAHPFAAVAGNWTGGGMISLTGEIQERLRCRGNHAFSRGNSLSLSIRCASDNYKFELTSNVVERGGQISGQWKEASYNVSGAISGRVAGNRITAVAKGDSFNAAIAVITNGNRQTVSIKPQATYVIAVEVALSKGR